MRLARLCFLLRLCFRRFGFFSGRGFLFLASRRLGFLCWSRFCFFCRCGFSFFLLLSRFRFSLLLGGRFRCWRGWLRLRLLLHFRDPLVLRKHPVLQIRWNNIRRFSVLINLDHAGGSGSTGPRRSASHTDSWGWCFVVF